jgi:hypothetical protein
LILRIAPAADAVRAHFHVSAGLSVSPEPLPSVEETRMSQLATLSRLGLVLSLASLLIAWLAAVTHIVTRLVVHHPAWIGRARVTSGALDRRPSTSFAYLRAYLRGAAGWEPGSFKDRNHPVQGKPPG